MRWSREDSNPIDQFLLARQEPRGQSPLLQGSVRMSLPRICDIERQSLPSRARGHRRFRARREGRSRDKPGNGDVTPEAGL
jgi:hypothetical protein